MIAGLMDAGSLIRSLLLPLLTRLLVYARRLPVVSITANQVGQLERRHSAISEDFLPSRDDERPQSPPS